MFSLVKTRYWLVLSCCLIFNTKGINRPRIKVRCKGYKVFSMCMVIHLIFFILLLWVSYSRCVPRWPHFPGEARPIKSSRIWATIVITTQYSNCPCNRGRGRKEAADRQNIREICLGQDNTGLFTLFLNTRKMHQ